MDRKKLRKVPKDKETGIPKKYVPKSLSKEDREKQIKSIKEGTDRPKVKSFKSKRSSFVVRFEKKYGYKINNFSRISKEIISQKGIDEIIAKGKGAYFSGGSSKSNPDLVGFKSSCLCNYGGKSSTSRFKNME